MNAKDLEDIYNLIDNLLKSKDFNNAYILQKFVEEYKTRNIQSEIINIRLFENLNLINTAIKNITMRLDEISKRIDELNKLIE